MRQTVRMRKSKNRVRFRGRLPDSDLDPDLDPDPDLSHANYRIGGSRQSNGQRMSANSNTRCDGTGDADDDDDHEWFAIRRRARRMDELARMRSRSVRMSVRHFDCALKSDALGV